MNGAVLTIGTRKGLFIARSRDGRGTWDVGAAQFLGSSIYSIGIDSRGEQPRLLLGTHSEHWGPSVAHSDDLGETWHDTEQGAVRFPEWAEASVARVWQLQPAGADQPGVVYAGTEPSALFRSEDGGESFSLIEGLWKHPHRPSWTPGYGGQAIHTVLPHPSDPDTVLVAMSAGGVYRTSDGGASWTAANTGIKAYFLPDQYPEFGQCVHKVARNAARPEQLFAQNHHGVYRSDDGGQTWTSIAEGLPADFGFPVVAHPDRDGTAYLFPLTSDGQRTPAELRCRVYRTDDAGASWKALNDGLPVGDHFGTVLRDAMCTDGGSPAGLYFGNRNGEVYASNDDGETWQLVAAHLPDVLCVRAAVLD